MFYHGQGSFPLGKGKTPKNRKDEKRKLVSENRSHGIIVYDGMTPVGWCQYGVSEELPRIQTSRTYNKVAPKTNGRSGRLWRVTCFFIDKDYRGKGVAAAALKAALNSIKQETGYLASSWKKIGWVQTLPGITGQRAHVFLAKKLQRGKAHREVEEMMRVQLFRVAEAYQLLRARAIVHAPTVVALAFAEKYLQ